MLPLRKWSMQTFCKHFGPRVHIKAHHINNKNIFHLKSISEHFPLMSHSFILEDQARVAQNV